jgi:hypothetical protein
MEAEERWFWVWLTIFTILLGTAPFAYWQGYHVSGICCAITGLGGFFLLIRDHLATTANKLPIKISLRVLTVVTLSMIVGQLIGYEIAGSRADVQLSSIQWWLYGLTLLLNVVVVSAVLSKKKPSKLVIHWANYRAVEGGGEEFQVGDFLRQIISGDSLVFDIENHNFVIGDKNFLPRDPLWGKEKRLQVNFSYAGSAPITTERREHGRLLLPEDSKIKWLMGETARLERETKEWKEKYVAENIEKTNFQKELARAENRKTVEVKKILPASRPRVVGVRYGLQRSDNRAGLFLANEGEPAYDVTVPDVTFGTSKLVFHNRSIARLVKADGDVLCETWVEREPHIGLLGDGLFHEMVSQRVDVIELPIRYKDGDNCFYITRCQIERDVSANGGLAVRYIDQKLDGSSISG